MADSTSDAVRVLTREEAADLLGISRLGLDRLHVDGKGPPRVRLSARRVGYRLSDLREWLDSRVEHGGAPALPSTPSARPEPNAPI